MSAPQLFGQTTQRARLRTTAVVLLLACAVGLVWLSSTLSGARMHNNEHHACGATVKPLRLHNGTTQPANHTGSDVVNSVTGAIGASGSPASLASPNVKLHLQAGLPHGEAEAKASVGFSYAFFTYIASNETKYIRWATLQVGHQQW